MGNAINITIEDRIWGWANYTLSAICGWNSEFLMTEKWLSPILSLSSQLVDGDEISVTVNNTKISVTFNTDHDTTLANFITAINTNTSVVALGITVALNSQDASGLSIVFVVERFGINLKTQVIHSGAGTAVASIVPIIWMHQNGTLPNQSYVSLHDMTSPMKMLPWKGKVELPIIQDPAFPSDPTKTIPDPAWPNGRQLIGWTEEHVISIKGYGQFTDDYLQNLRMCLELEAVQDYLDNNGLSAIIAMPIQDASVLVDDQAERRCVMDVTFRISLSMYDEPGYINVVQYTGSVVGSDQEVIQVK